MPSKALSPEPPISPLLSHPCVLPRHTSSVLLVFLYGGLSTLGSCVFTEGGSTADHLLTLTWTWKHQGGPFLNYFSVRVTQYHDQGNLIWGSWLQRVRVHDHHGREHSTRQQAWRWSSTESLRLEDTVTVAEAERAEWAF